MYTNKTKTKAIMSQLLLSEEVYYNKRCGFNTEVQGHSHLFECNKYKEILTAASLNNNLESQHDVFQVRAFDESLLEYVSEQSYHTT